MTLSTTVRTFTIAGALLCASAVAQTRVCLGGDLEHLSPAQRAACTSKMQAVRDVAASLQAPGDWHFVVVCGEQGWRSYAAFGSATQEAVLMAAADTNLEQHETFLRETRLDVADSRSLQRLLSQEISAIPTRRTEQGPADKHAVGSIVLGSNRSIL